MRNGILAVVELSTGDVWDSVLDGVYHLVHKDGCTCRACAFRYVLIQLDLWCIRLADCLHCRTDSAEGKRGGHQQPSGPPTLKETRQAFAMSKKSFYVSKLNLTS